MASLFCQTVAHYVAVMSHALSAFGHSHTAFSSGFASVVEYCNGGHGSVR